MANAVEMEDKIAYLVRCTGRAEAEIVAEAMETGLVTLWAKQRAAAYLAGDLDRAQAVAELGEDRVEELDFARDAMERDIAWGLKGV